MRSNRIVNLVFNGDAYEVVDNSDLLTMKARGEVRFEKARRQGNMYGYFYVRK